MKCANDRRDFAHNTSYKAQLNIIARNFVEIFSNFEINQICKHYAKRFAILLIVHNSRLETVKQMNSSHSHIHVVLFLEEIQTKKKKEFRQNFAKIHESIYKTSTLTASQNQIMQQKRIEIDDKQIQIFWRYNWLEQSSISWRFKNSVNAIHLIKQLIRNNHVNIMTRSTICKHE